VVPRWTDIQRHAGYSQRIPGRDTTYFSPASLPTIWAFTYLSVADVNYQGRGFCCTEEPSEALSCFLSRGPGQDGKRAKKLDPGKCCCFDNAAFPFEISAHPVDHSIFGATAYILRGEITDKSKRKWEFPVMRNKLK